MRSTEVHSCAVLAQQCQIFRLVTCIFSRQNLQARRVPFRRPNVPARSTFVSLYLKPSCGVPAPQGQAAIRSRASRRPASALRPQLAALDELIRPGATSRSPPAAAASTTSRRSSRDSQRLRLKARGAHPFVVPAMGSHGGATAEGQAEILQVVRHLRGDDRRAGALVDGGRRAAARRSARSNLHGSSRLRIGRRDSRQPHQAAHRFSRTV